jgi:NADH-quinone oxidoreductase subunit E
MIPLGTKAGPVASPFSPEQQKRFDEGFEEAVAKYPPERRRAALLPALHLAQDALGWLPEAAMAYVGHLLDIPPVRVREVATFYTMYRLHPVGRQHIGVCNSVSCWAMGSEKIIEHCASRLGIRPGETTRDGQFSLEEVACLASCGTAPAALVNNFTYVESVTPQSLDQLIEKLRKEPGQPMATERKP